MDKYFRKIQELQNQIQEIDFPIPGTLQTQYRRCGKKNCKCAESEDQMHGPYYLWYRKENGKLTTTSVSEDDLYIYEECIANRVKLENVVQKMLTLGAEYIKTHLSSLNNSKKP